LGGTSEKKAVLNWILGGKKGCRAKQEMQKHRINKQKLPSKKREGKKTFKTMGRKTLQPVSNHRAGSLEQRFEAPGAEHLPSAVSGPKLCREPKKKIGA